MGRGIVESGLFRAEQYGLEVRTTDPATYSEGEAWIRSDLAPDTDQIATLRFADTDSTTIDIPVFAVGTSESSVSEVWRVRVNSSLGFIPIIAEDDAAFQEIRIQHAGGTHALHNAPGLAAYFSVAIDSTNSPVEGGETLNVDYTVTNTGEIQGSQDIRLRDFDDSVVDTDVDVTLDGSQSSSATLSWTTQDGDAGEQQIDVLSDDAVVSTTVTVAYAIPDSGVARWTFDTDDTESGTALDVWNSNDGTINGATTGVSGANQTYTTNEAYSFDGNDDFVAVSNLGIAGSVSLAAWVITTNGSNQKWICGEGYGSNGETHAIATNVNTGGEWGMVLDDDSALEVIESSGSSFSDGTWTHLCAVFDAPSSDVTLYEDGSSIGSGTFSSGGAIQPDGAFEIGRQMAGSFYFEGDIDDPRAYEKPLSSTKVSNLYNTGSI